MNVSLENVIIWFALIGRVFQNKNIPIKLPGQGTGRKLLNMIDIVYNVDVGSCARECLLRRKCLGIEYVLQTGRCSLYANEWTRTTTTTTFRMLDLPDIRMWPQGMVGTCASRPCPKTMKCIPSFEKYTCIPFCDMLVLFLPDGPYKPRLNPKVGAFVGTTVYFHCDIMYMLPSQPASATCQEDSSWKISELYDCLEVQNCAHIKRCKPTYPDGLYWVFSGNTTKVANCTGMDYDTPTTTLIADSQKVKATYPSCNA